MLSIGEFSRICGVTTRALRHYDDIDLIKPTHTSRENGYRFYDISQIRQLLLINRLKEYGFSLEAIGEIIKSGDKNLILDKIVKKQEQIRHQIKQYEAIEKQIMDDILNLKRGIDIMAFINDIEVQLVETKPQNILYSRQRMSVDDYCKYIGNLFELAHSTGMKIVGAPMSIYYDKEFDPTDNDTAVALPVATVNEHTTILSGGLCATAVCKGPYSTLPYIYAKLTEWISAEGYQVVSAPYEQYVKGPMEVNSAEDFITKIYFPVNAKKNADTSFLSNSTRASAGCMLL